MVERWWKDGGRMREGRGMGRWELVARGRCGRRWRLGLVEGGCEERYTMWSAI